jgi:hypothetical protein
MIQCNSLDECCIDSYNAIESIAQLSNIIVKGRHFNEYTGDIYQNVTCG